jgi:hypothetical protein
MNNLILELDLAEVRIVLEEKGTSQTMGLSLPKAEHTQSSPGSCTR